MIRVTFISNVYAKKSPYHLRMIGAMKMKSGSTQVGKRRIAFLPRYSLAFILVLVTFVCVALSIWAANNKHWQAVRKLRDRTDVEIVFARPAPTFFDKFLGDYRFDDVYEIKGSGNQVPRVSADEISNLRGLKKFDGDSVMVLHAQPGDVGFLLPHQRTLESLSVTYSESAVDQIEKFIHLKELSLQSPLDVSMLGCLEVLTTLRCSHFSPQNVHHASALEVLDLRNLNDKSSVVLEDLAEISNLRAIHLYKIACPLNLEDISSNHPGLEYLSVKEVAIQSFDQIASLPRLKGLELNKCQVDGQPTSLKSLGQLENCYITDCDLMGWDWLAGCSGLSHLILKFERRSEVKLDVLASLPKLKILIARNFDVLDSTAPVMPALEIFRLEEATIDDALLSEFKQLNPDMRVEVQHHQSPADR
jgi:hypothetical protein